MAVTIPDLWSDDIRVDVLTPLAILRAQEPLLSKKTQGILEARVSTTSEKDWELHQLDLIAPALHNYRLTLLTAKHHRELIYPVEVVSRVFIPPLASQADPLGIGSVFPAIEAVRNAGKDRRSASTQQEFITLVREILHSGLVRSWIQSLIARSKEPREGEKSAPES